MRREPEAELMLEAGQARAYAEADWSAAHEPFIRFFRSRFPQDPVRGHVLDLGCGAADISIRFARAFPECHIDGVDGSPAMLQWGRQALAQAGLEGRVHLHLIHLPALGWPRPSYQAIISNSLLHHLEDPRVLWRTVRERAEPGAPVLIMDLLRPESRQAARQLTRQHAGEAPPVLARDFYRSLLAAYRPQEIRRQLKECALETMEVEVVSDRHWIVWGRVS